MATAHKRINTIDSLMIDGVMSSDSMQDFFGKLMDLFRICEDLENVDSLHIIFKIVRGIILLNSSQIFEKIFGDELILDIVGCLEYDPEAPHIHHRSFLKEHVVYKEAIPIKDSVVLSKIRQTYRVGYLKDVVLSQMLDEATIANLNSIISLNNAMVVSRLKDDNTFIQELFAKLSSPSTSAESKKNLIHFLHEFCTLSKSLQMVQQVRLLRDLVNEGIFDIIVDILQSSDKKLVLMGTDILILLNQDPNLLRSHVIRQEGLSLFELLRPLTEDEQFQKADLAVEYEEAVFWEARSGKKRRGLASTKNEEIAWRQRSRVQRIKNGDKNTKYFHRVATTHKRFSTIDSLHIDGVGSTEPLTIKSSIWNSTRIYTGKNRKMFEKSFNATFVPLIPKKVGATELILLVFEACSVLEVNWRKISLFQLQEVQQIQLLASSLDCRVENLPTVYVGMPLGSKHKALGIWDVIIVSTEKKI
ncbi:hypothetical protein MTR67_003169 [Solanum verrucosum]|uniref:Serine/threonine-protein phosphatase 4 regulatory subunit 3-like central domain-containing protein n=1 Tax=Solanum verrucosum TaxID=315347 RepID=A0AAF0PXJ5_SOLVR|nr:hypothetical protein MTR67_003169 [Solanum verrucosum]